MTNQQWQTLFTWLATNHIRFYVDWVDWPDYSTDQLESISLQTVQEEGLADPGIGGPFYYREIKAVRVPYSYEIPKTMRGEVYGYQTFHQNLSQLETNTSLAIQPNKNELIFS